MEFVKSGFGIGYATREFIKKDLDEKLLYEIKIEPAIPKRYIGIVTLNNKVSNFSVNKLINIMTNKKTSNN